MKKMNEENHKESTISGIFINNKNEKSLNKQTLKKIENSEIDKRDEIIKESITKEKNFLDKISEFNPEYTSSLFYSGYSNDQLNNEYFESNKVFKTTIALTIIIYMIFFELSVLSNEFYSDLKNSTVFIVIIIYSLFQKLLCLILYYNISFKSISYKNTVVKRAKVFLYYFEVIIIYWNIIECHLQDDTYDFKLSKLHRLFWASGIILYGGLVNLLSASKFEFIIINLSYTVLWIVIAVKESSVKSENGINFITEIVCNVIVIGNYFLFNVINKLQKENYENKKRSELLNNMYCNFLKNQQSRLISFINGEVIYTNKIYDDDLKLIERFEGNNTISPIIKASKLTIDNNETTKNVDRNIALNKKISKNFQELNTIEEELNLNINNSNHNNIIVNNNSKKEKSIHNKKSNKVNEDTDDKDDRDNNPKQYVNLKIEENDKKSSVPPEVLLQCLFQINNDGNGKLFLKDALLNINTNENSYINLGEFETITKDKLNSFTISQKNENNNFKLDKEKLQNLDININKDANNTDNIHEIKVININKNSNNINIDNKNYYSSSDKDNLSLLNNNSNAIIGDINVPNSNYNGNYKKSLFSLFKDPISSQLKYYFKDSKYYYVYVRKINLYNGNENIDIMLNDITSIKTAESQSLTMNVRKKLFSNIAHEFKTPLLSIIALINELKDDIIKFCEEFKLDKEELNIYRLLLNNINNENNEIEEAYTEKNNNFNFNAIINNNNSAIRNISNTIAKLKSSNSIANVNSLNSNVNSGINSNNSYSINKKCKTNSSNSLFTQLNKSCKKSSGNSNTNNNANNILSNYSSKDLLSESLLPLLHQINSMSEYTLFLIDDIIFYSSSNNEKDKYKVVIEKINISKIIVFCDSILKSLLKMKGKEDKIKPNINIDPNLQNIEIETDGVRLKQILLNFISNAVKFTRRGTITFSIIVKEDNMIEISITDTGSGMNESDLNKLKKFSSEREERNVLDDANQNDNRMGTGLGLNIVHGFCNKLNYKFVCESELNKGSCFGVLITCSNLNNLLYSKKMEVNRKYSQPSHISNSIIKHKKFSSFTKSRHHDNYSFYGNANSTKSHNNLRNNIQYFNENDTMKNRNSSSIIEINKKYPFNYLGLNLTKNNNNNKNNILCCCICHVNSYRNHTVNYLNNKRCSCCSNSNTSNICDNNITINNMKNLSCKNIKNINVKLKSNESNNSKSNSHTRLVNCNENCNCIKLHDSSNNRNYKYCVNNDYSSKNSPNNLDSYPLNYIKTPNTFNLHDPDNNNTNNNNNYNFLKSQFAAVNKNSKNSNYLNYWENNNNENESERDNNNNIANNTNNTINRKYNTNYLHPTSTENATRVENNSMLFGKDKINTENTYKTTNIPKILEEKDSSIKVLNILGGITNIINKTIVNNYQIESLNSENNNKNSVFNSNASHTRINLSDNLINDLNNSHDISDNTQDANTIFKKNSFTIDSHSICNNKAYFRINKISNNKKIFNIIDKDNDNKLNTSIETIRFNNENYIDKEMDFDLLKYNSNIYNPNSSDNSEIDSRDDTTVKNDYFSIDVIKDLRIAKNDYTANDNNDNNAVLIPVRNNKDYFEFNIPGDCLIHRQKENRLPFKSKSSNSIKRFKFNHFNEINNAKYAKDINNLKYKNLGINNQNSQNTIRSSYNYDITFNNEMICKDTKENKDTKYDNSSSNYFTLKDIKNNLISYSNCTNGYKASNKIISSSKKLFHPLCIPYKPESNKELRPYIYNNQENYNYIDYKGNKNYDTERNKQNPQSSFINNYLSHGNNYYNSNSNISDYNSSKMRIINKNSLFSFKNNIYMENTSTNAKDKNAIISKQESDFYRNINKKESITSFTIFPDKRKDNINHYNEINNVNNDRYNDTSNDYTIQNSINILKTGLSNEERNKIMKKLSTKLQFLNNENKSINKSKSSISNSNFNKNLNRTSNNAHKSSTTQVFRAFDSKIIASNNNKNNIETNNLSNNILSNKKKILVVDDSPNIRKAVVNLIQTVFNSDDKFTIIEGKDGIDIINSLLSQEDNGDKEQIEYVFSDENMEYLNGSKAFSIINDLIKDGKLGYSNNSLKLISITGIDNKEEMDVIYKRGANYVLPKPLGINILKQLKSEIEALK